VKPLTMTEALESALRQGACEECFDSRAAEFLIDEIDALRRLPVIATCDDCAQCVAVEDDAAWCEHPDANADHFMGRAVDATRPPPAWCPLRGAQ